MDKLFSKDSNYKAMVEVAKKLGVHFVGRTRYDLANDLNAALEAAAKKEKPTILEFDLKIAEQALTAEERAIFQMLYNKVVDFEMNKKMEEMFETIQTPSFFSVLPEIEGLSFEQFLINNLGGPGLGMPDNIKDLVSKIEQVTGTKVNVIKL